ncbi:hypothetical protein HO133_009010 [Letharia lupina]|uniref:Uncharacterized protein n=1 Tax=Letharia lupina TaxID=560253 RepID=A0A8H6FFP1_9LECA|nr:uncharacterized protein HO133_009010 [Letharia lupina]KAF6226144.1 hypothetical protein HO133_009010 [Letharia lupina]
MATGTDPAKRLRSDLFTEHVDNTHSCQQVLKDNMHALDFLQFYRRTMARRLGKEKNSENLAGTQARYGQYLQDL